MLVIHVVLLRIYQAPPAVHPQARRQVADEVLGVIDALAAEKELARANYTATRTGSCYGLTGGEETGRSSQDE